MTQGQLKEDQEIVEFCRKCISYREQLTGDENEVTDSCLFVCLFILLSVCLFACLFVCLLVCLFVWLPVCSSLVCLSLCLFVCLFVTLSICLFVYLFVLCLCSTTFHLLLIV